MSSCLRCGASSSPLYATVNLSSELASDSRAEIKMRQAFILDTSEGLRRIMPAETLLMSFGSIREVLEQQGAVFYFKKATDKALFLLVYPQYSSENI